MGGWDNFYPRCDARRGCHIYTHTHPRKKEIANHADFPRKVLVEIVVWHKTMFEKIRGENSICNREEKAWQHFRIEKIRNLVTRAHSPHLEGGGGKTARVDLKPTNGGGQNLWESRRRKGGERLSPEPGEGGGGGP